MFAADSVRCIKRGGGGGGGYDGSPHVYWRIYITGTDGDSTYIAQINEMEYRSSVGGLSESVGGVASGSSQYIGTGFGYAAAFDGSATTGWVCNSDQSLPQWLVYQHTAAIPVAEVMIQAGDNSDRAARAPIDFEIQYSDNGTDWVTALTVVGEPAWGVSEIRTYTL